MIAASCSSGSRNGGGTCDRRRRMEKEEEEDSWPAAEEVLKAVFPLLGGQDLAASMCVCRRWREIGSEEYLWKQLCARRWPSVLCDSSGSAKQTNKGTMMATVAASRPYFSLFSSFCKKTRVRTMPSPKLRFEDLEFYVDIWSNAQPLFSAVVHGPLVLSRIVSPPAGISPALQDHLQSDSYKLTVPVSPRFAVNLQDSPKVSMLLRRRDDQRVACIVDMSGFDYHDGQGNLAIAFEYLQISPLYPFVSPIRAWVALLLLDSAQNGKEVFGIELDFFDAANCEREVLCLLEILDWKSIG